ncbi:chemotaxis response regulator protein-glutamate methylesterase [Leptospira gomenensis]|uniref:Protein-glutamate methylesterase/protein-glutamine glutaminase n=1 Tax=Leptospira gomenensis TaxID=2484974 RepID=A0A5F1YA13_9LEPT|nr:chemotaxis response regulator protein-glutamate methylesterase [Leptospira gomenensis]TGK31745.1 chemotaxis response regulator protein-glutamate methylesterase [Leptospira gomenensis]TGK36124.1 chemotaxis response regulator protein-glutamate methylesterase [Leptospira gomenensis]TGK41627.1 chemotaxis response regulator protein-glutamate methylesterase [Leptospira gomenensis]TGK61414.1 chemotaxis response regulator protein-glutamate methylesterase [Leptospira gomenensis]
MVPHPVRAVIVDDSLLVRNIISDQIQKDSKISVVATGKTGVDCIELAQKLQPDVIILDVEMPVMDGLTALHELQKKKLGIPVIMLSVLTQNGAEATFKALEYGAIDFVPKPSSAFQFDPEEIGNILKSKIIAYFESKIPVPSISGGKKIPVTAFPAPTSKKTPIQVICIGTSTGGPRALQEVFSRIPEDISLPILVVQHMPAGFTKAFAMRLNDHSKIRVKEAEDGEPIESGVGYVAPGDLHLSIQSRGGRKWIALNREAPVNGHRPSIEVLLNSAVEEYKSGIIGVIMTGMGKDGSAAMVKVKEAGGSTIAQDEQTSVIYGMNRQAVEMGGVEYIEPVTDIINRIQIILKERGI